MDTDRIKYKDKKCEYGDLNWKALMDPHLNLWWTLDRSVRQNVADNGLVEYKLNIIYIYIYIFIGGPDCRSEVFTIPINTCTVLPFMVWDSYTVYRSLKTKWYEH